MDLKILKDIPPWEWPRGAGKMFLGILRDPQADASDRLLAAEFAGDLVVMSDALADALLLVVGSAAEPEELRAQAAISLGPALEQAFIDEFDDPDSVPISEKSYRKIKQSLRKVYLDSGVPKLVRRRTLEASVRAPEEWHAGVIRSAYASDDQEWKLTAVFCMNHVRGFDKQILGALESADPGIHYQAVRAAGTWAVDAAWPHIAALLQSADTSADSRKDLLLAAIEASAGIRPREAGALLVDLTHSDDEDIAEAADEAMSTAEEFSDDEFDDEDDEDEGGGPGSGKRETIH